MTDSEKLLRLYKLITTLEQLEYIEAGSVYPLIYRIKRQFQSFHEYHFDVQRLKQEIAHSTDDWIGKNTPLIRCHKAEQKILRVITAVNEIIEQEIDKFIIKTRIIDNVIDSAIRGNKLYIIEITRDHDTSEKFDDKDKDKTND